jgi:hypothetical protein
MRLTQWLDEFRDDVTFAIRQLRRSPGFTLVAALTLALGIGANSAIFALADATLIRPLPFSNADRLVMLWEHADSVDRGVVAPFEFDAWNTRNHVFEVDGGCIAQRTRDDRPGWRRRADSVTNGLCPVFRRPRHHPIAGRTFVADDDRPSPDAVVLSEGCGDAGLAAIHPHRKTDHARCPVIHRHRHRAGRLSDLRPQRGMDDPPHLVGTWS